ncbi:MAG: hypothetical protein IJ613_01640 [Muribaculaceae bacterium]|nr:hypothetical protein [Muribaculaceae bacterium]MBR1474260.1 hypothetical protein [Muribaculaceae bacterium]
MKKTLFAVMALLCMTLGLTACGGDDEPTQTVNATATYQIDFSADLVEVANIAIVYVGDDGQVSIESVAAGSRQWLRQVTCPIKGKSVDFGFKVVYTPKREELTRDNYELTATAKLTASTPTSNRTFTEALMNSTVRANKVSETLSKGNDKPYGVTVTKDGSINRNDDFTVSI